MSLHFALGRLRLGGRAVYRNLAFILFTVPSTPSFTAFPNDTTATAEKSGVLLADYAIDDWGLTLGAGAGIIWPAFITARVAAGNSPPTNLGSQIQVFRSARDRQLLNPGDEVEPAYEGKLRVVLRQSQHVAAAAELVGIHDGNRARFTRDPAGVVVRRRITWTTVGINVVLRGRF